MYCRQLIALLLVCAYLILPVDSFANHASHPATRTAGSTTLANLGATDVTQSHSPCSDQDDADHNGSDDCGACCSCCSCCSFFAPLPSQFTWRALQPASSFSVHVPFRRLPEVYLPIFVPPQNRV